jgi:hypothetical protein
MLRTIQGKTAHKIEVSALWRAEGGCQSTTLTPFEAQGAYEK